MGRRGGKEGWLLAQWDTGLLITFETRLRIVGLRSSYIQGDVPWIRDISRLRI
jgi:hypothetical protein